MSERTEPNLNEMINAAGSGAGLALPPAFVMVNPKQHRKYKKGNEDKVDGRSKGARALFNRCLLYTSPSPRDATLSRMPSSA